MRSSLILLFVMLAASPCWAAEEIEPFGPAEVPAVERFYPDQHPAAPATSHQCESIFGIVRRVCDLLDWIIWGVKVVAFSVFGLGTLNVILSLIAVRRAGRIARRLDGLLVSPRKEEL